MKKPELDLLERADAERLKAAYNQNQRLGELAGITAFFAMTPVYLMVVVEYAMFNSVDYLGWVIAGGFIAGLLGADFVSGFFHWAADNWGHEGMPIVGTHFIRAFRHHHIEPEEMTHHGFIELNGNNCITSLPAFILGYLTLDPATPMLSMFLAVFWLSLAYWVFGTNQFHAWAHTKNPPVYVRVLQKMQLVLTPKHHDVHHTFPHKRNYAITNGWTNHVTGALHFYEILEWMITAVSGESPEHVKAVEARRAPLPTESQP